MHIIDGIAKILGYVLNWIYVGLTKIGITNLGITIIVFALVMLIILFPFTYVQQRNSKIMQIAQPELNKIAKKYRNKKDQDSMMKMQLEQQQVYKKYGTSQTSGCLVNLIQFPILFGIIQIVYNIPNYIPSIQNVYMKIARPMAAAMTKAGGDSKLVKHMTDAAADLRATSYFKDYKSPTDTISLIYRFKESTWDKAREWFASYPDVLSHITSSKIDQLHALNNFLPGINISEYPSGHGIISVYVIIPVLAALFQWIQTKTIRMPDMSGNEQMAGSARMMKNMTNFMPIFSLVFYYALPCGIGLYWASKAFFTIIQQVSLNWYFDHCDMDAKIARLAAKSAKKGKKSFTERMYESSLGTAEKAGTTPSIPGNAGVVKKNAPVAKAARINTRKIAAPEVSYKHTDSAGDSSDKAEPEKKASEDNVSQSTGMTEKKPVSRDSGTKRSIAEIANMLKSEQ